MRKARFPLYLLPFLFLVACATPVPITGFYHSHDGEGKHWHPAYTYKTNHYHPPPQLDEYADVLHAHIAPEGYRYYHRHLPGRAHPPVQNRSQTSQAQRRTPEVQSRPRPREVERRLSPLRTPEELLHEIQGGDSVQVEITKDIPARGYAEENPYDDLIRRTASAYHVEPALVKAVIRVESGFDPRATSERGARGLMQLMPDTARRYGVRNVYDPAQNIRGGVLYLRDLMAQFNSDTALVLAAYNAGESAVVAYQGIPPYGETRDFVRRVLQYFRYYMEAFG
jgi:Transglycosylase SLT domain